MKMFLSDIFLKPFQSKRLFFSGLIAWFVFSAFFWSVVQVTDWKNARAQDAYVEEINSLPASEWIEYAKIEPVQPVFRFDELITMRSFITKKRSATISWNDILYCDKMDTNNYTRIDAVVDSFYNEVVEEESYTRTWVYGKFDLQRPYKPRVDCFVRSQQNICPAESVEDSRIVCRRQTIDSHHFLLTNP